MIANSQPNNPLHGITLEMIITQLVDQYGWAELGKRIPIKCFTDNPSIKSSLKFLRQTPWARTKVEDLYLKSISKWKGETAMSSSGKKDKGNKEQKKKPKLNPKEKRKLKNEKKKNTFMPGWSFLNLILGQNIQDQPCEGSHLSDVPSQGISWLAQTCRRAFALEKSIRQSAWATQHYLK